MNDLSLHPDHLADLKKSGLSDATIKAAGIYSLRPGDINKIVGPFFSGKVSSVLVFPYPGHDGFIRCKLFPAVQTDNGTLKYFQPPKTGNHLYIPPGVETIFADVSIPLYLTEGEKKSLKGTQEKLFCIGIGGLWNWSDGSEEKNLIADFALINWDRREVGIVPDNDWSEPSRRGEEKNLKQAVNQLAHHLIDKGAHVHIIELPAGPLKGLDDYLSAYNIEEFLKLPRNKIRKLTIGEEIGEVSSENLKLLLRRIANTSLTETQVESYVDAIHKKLGLPKSAIKKDIKNLKAPDRGEITIDRLLECEDEPGDRWSAQVYKNNILSFGTVIGGEPIHVGSDGQILILEKDAIKFRKTKLTKEAVKRFRAGEDVSGRDLVERLKVLFSDHIIFKDRRLSFLLSVWVVGTYLFKIFRFYGYLFINSPVKRCGKSLLLDILAVISFNATSRLLNPSESSVFREVDGNDATLVIDEIESLSNKDKEKRPEMIALLNAGFQRGATVSRTETKDKEFIVTYFNAYGPKVLAGIKSIADTIEDRCFKITMARKTKDEKIKRFNLRILDPQIDRIRDDLFLWALRHGPDVAEVYEEIKEVPGTEGFDDRLKDIIEPLLSIASVIDAQANDETIPTVRGLITTAKDMVGMREAAESLISAIPVAVAILQEALGILDERFVSAEELFEKFKAEEDLAFIHSKRGMAFFLSKLDINRIPPKREGGKVTRGYILKEGPLADLERRYA